MNKIVKEIISYIIIIIIVVLVKEFIITPIKVNGTSMENTLRNGDLMILDKFSYRFTDIKRFDIVVLKMDDEYLIKRVIGLPGDKVVYKDNQLYINDKVIKESFNHKETSDYIMDEKIPDNYYFVVGDNRPVSIDSRIIGLVHENDILGKTSLVLFPFNRIGIKN